LDTQIHPATGFVPGTPSRRRQKRIAAETPAMFSETLAVPCSDDEQRLNLSQVHKHIRLKYQWVMWKMRMIAKGTSA
jgi:hypothetical protein